jgi:hypothetical protein
MATIHTRRQFLFYLFTSLCGLWASRHSAVCLLAILRPIAAAPRQTCPHPRFTTVYDATNRLLTTTYEAGPFPRCCAEMPFGSSPPFVYDGHPRTKREHSRFQALPPGRVEERA